jgi:Ni,Fe-hydrogenase I cytochrome b subunit
MRKLFVILSILFTSLGIVFSVLPFDTLALLPLGLGLVFSLIAYSKSVDTQKRLPKWLVIVILICTVFVLAKTYLIKDEVAVDTNFEKEKVQTQQEAKKDLEDLEKDLE